MASPNSRYYQYIKPLAQNKFIRSYSPYIFSLIMVAVLIFFAIRPTFSTILNLQKDIQNHSETLARLKEKSQNITLAKRNLESLDKLTRNKIYASVPGSPEVGSVVQSLRSSLPKEASSASVIQIQPVSLTPKVLSKEPQLQTVVFTFNNEGSFEIFMQTLSSLVRAQRTLSIESITISKQSGGPTVMSLTGKGYYLK